MGIAAPAFAGAPQCVHFEYAGFGVRFLARFIDMIVVSVVGLLTGVATGFMVGVVLAASGRAVQPATEALAALTVPSYLLSLAAGVMFHTVAEAVHGSTPGKMLLGLTVISDTHRPCGFGAALGREMAYFVDGLFLGLVGYESMRHSQWQQRFGDKWAHTVVVYRRSLPPALRRSSERFVLACLAACSCYGVLGALSLLVKL
jgi:uncharacterized RDD family membrane protein YckC